MKFFLSFPLPKSQMDAHARYKSIINAKHVFIRYTGLRKEKQKDLVFSSQNWKTGRGGDAQTPSTSEDEEEGRRDAGYNQFPKAETTTSFRSFI